MSAQNILAERQRTFEDLLTLQPAEIQEVVRRLLALPGVQDTTLFGLIIQRPDVFFQFVAAQMQLNGVQIEAFQMPGREPQDLSQDFSDLRGFIQVYLTAASLLNDVTLAYLIVRPEDDDGGHHPVTLEVAYGRSLLNPNNPENMARDALAVAATLADPNQPRHITGIDVIHMFRTAFPRNSLLTLLGNLDRTRHPQEFGMMADGFALFVHIFLYFADLANPGGVWGSLAGNEDDSAAFLYALLDMWTGTRQYFDNDADRERYERYLAAVRVFANTALSGFGPILAQFRRSGHRGRQEEIEATCEHHWNLIILWIPNLRQEILNVFEATRGDMFRLVDEIQMMTQIQRGDRVMEANIQTHVNVEALVPDHNQFGNIAGVPAPAGAEFQGFQPPEDLLDGTETGPDCQLCTNPMGPPPRQEPQRKLRCCNAEVGAVCHAEAVRLYGHCPFCRQGYGKNAENYRDFYDDQDPPSGPDGGAGSSSQGGAAAQGKVQGSGAGGAQAAAPGPSSGGAGGGGGGCADGVVVYSRARRSHKFLMCPFPASRYGTGNNATGPPGYGPPTAADDWFVDTYVPSACWQYVQKYRSRNNGEPWEGRMYLLSNESLPAPSAFELQAFSIWLLEEVKPLYVQEVNRPTATG